MLIGLVAFLFLVEVFGIAAKANTVKIRCPRIRISDDRLLGENTARNGKPLYKLMVKEKPDRFQTTRTYRLRLHGYGDKKFRDASLVAESMNGTCGAGSFVGGSKFLYQPKGCPHIISTNKKQKMEKATFDWMAPKCGCIRIRAVVISGKGLYYAGSSTGNDDQLTVTKCMNAKTGHHETESNYMAPASLTMVDASNKRQANRNEVQTWEGKLETLCRTTRHYGGASMATNRHFRHRHRLTFISDVSFEHMKLILENRRSDMMKCCDKTGHQRKACIGDIRRRRIDSFCAKGEPDIPFSKASVDWMKDRGENCCWVLGGERYECFRKPITMGTAGTHDHLVNELDEFDPMNDLDDYPMDIKMNQGKKDARHAKHSMPSAVKRERLKKTKTVLSRSRTRQTKRGNIKSADLRMDDVFRANIPGIYRTYKHSSLNTKLNKTNRPAVRTTASTSTVMIPTTTTTTIPLSTVSPFMETSLKETEQADDRRSSFLTKKVLGIRQNGLFVNTELADLERKAWKVNLKLVCCTKGQERVLTSIQEGVSPKCMQKARQYSETMSRGRKVCGAHFWMCCSNAASSDVNIGLCGDWGSKIIYDGGMGGSVDSCGSVNRSWKTGSIISRASAVLENQETTMMSSFLERLKFYEQEGNIKSDEQREHKPAKGVRQTTTQRSVSDAHVTEQRSTESSHVFKQIGEFRKTKQDRRRKVFKRRKTDNIDQRHSPVTPAEGADILNVMSESLEDLVDKAVAIIKGSPHTSRRHTQPPSATTSPPVVPPRDTREEGDVLGGFTFGSEDGERSRNTASKNATSQSESIEKDGGPRFRYQEPEFHERKTTHHEENMPVKSKSRADAKLDSSDIGSRLEKSSNQKSRKRAQKVKKKNRKGRKNNDNRRQGVLNA